MYIYIYIYIYIYVKLMKTNTEHYISLNENLESELEQILLNMMNYCCTSAG